MSAEERKRVTVMSVGFPGVILWHTCPKFCRALPEASHFTCLKPGIISQHLALLPQEFDCCPPALSEVIATRLFIVHWVEWCPSGDIVHSRPSSFSVLPVVSRFITGIFSPVHPFHAEIQ